MASQSKAAASAVLKSPGLYLCQGLAAILFLWLLYGQEDRLLAEMAIGATAEAHLSTRHALVSLTPSFLPGDFWRLGWPLSLLAAGFLIFARWRWYFLGSMGLLTSLLLVADRLYHDFFSSVISLQSAKAAPQLWGVRDSVVAAFRWSDALLPLSFLAFFVFAYCYNASQGQDLKTHPRIFLADKLAAVVFGIAAIWSVHIAFRLPGKGLDNLKGLKDHRFLPNYLSSNKDYAVQFGVLNFHLKEVGGALSGGPPPSRFGEEERKLVQTVFSERKRLNDRPSPFFGLARGRNVVVISLEAFQHWLLDATLEGEPVTPVLSGLRSQALTWDFILDNAGIGGTSDAEFSVLTGLLADPRGIASMSHPARIQPLALPSALRAVGYRTASFHGNDPSFWNRDVNHPVLGIETLFFRNRFQGNRIGLGIPDRPFFRQAAAYLNRMESPFFAFLISLTSHHPYNFLPPRAATPATGLPEGSMADRYLRSCHYADKALGDFLNLMKANGLWRNSLFVIYGDHVPPLSDSAAALLWERIGIDPKSPRQARVPFLILVPGEEATIASRGAEFRAVVGGLHDLFPTVLHLLGLEIPFGVYGTHLLVANENRGLLPLFKGGNFVFRGILYDSKQLAPIIDDRGAVFLAESEAVHHRQAVVELHLKAGIDILVHRYVFDHRAQQAIALGEPPP